MELLELPLEDMGIYVNMLIMEALWLSRLMDVIQSKVKYHLQSTFYIIWKQNLGVFSTTDSCDPLEAKPEFTPVESYLDWIKSNMGTCTLGHNMAINIPTGYGKKWGWRSEALLERNWIFLFKLSPNIYFIKYIYYLYHVGRKSAM